MDKKVSSWVVDRRWNHWDPTTRSPRKCSKLRRLTMAHASPPLRVWWSSNRAKVFDGGRNLLGWSVSIDELQTQLSVAQPCPPTMREKERMWKEDREVGRGKDRDEGEGGETIRQASPSPERMVDGGRGLQCVKGRVPSLSLFTRLGHASPVLNQRFFFFLYGQNTHFALH